MSSLGTPRFTVGFPLDPFLGANKSFRPVDIDFEEMRIDETKL
jgi:hypothetical protein